MSKSGIDVGRGFARSNSPGGRAEIGSQRSPRHVKCRPAPRLLRGRDRCPPTWGRFPGARAEHIGREKAQVITITVGALDIGPRNDSSQAVNIS